jgi:hypothetical protein
MKTHRFTINVPNPTETTVVVDLRLEPDSVSGLKPPLDVPRAALKLTAFFLSLQPCAPEGPSKLTLTLKPYTSVDVYVTAVTADPPSQRDGGTAAVQVIDRRGGKVVGGAMFVCVDGPASVSPGTFLPTKRPCPVALAKNPYGVPLDGHPTKAIIKTLPLAATFTLVVPITNPGGRALLDVTVYLEHLGRTGAAFLPGRWNVGTLTPGQVFYATWTVMSGSRPGTFQASVVVESRNADPTRLMAPVRMSEERPSPVRRGRG